MSSDYQEIFTKENLDGYLKELSKEYRKLSGKSVPAELILIGGASVLINYSFRGMTTDVDALIHASSSMKDAINRVGDLHGLPNGWLNTDFTKTESYTPKLFEYSVYYKTFSNILSVRTVSSEYLIAMKLRSGRSYKNDRSDILGILAEHEQKGNPISLDQIKKAVTDLYGSWSFLSDDIVEFIENVMNDGRFELLFSEMMKEEKVTNDELLKIDEKYPGRINKSTIADVIESIKERTRNKQTDDWER